MVFLHQNLSSEDSSSSMDINNSVSGSNAQQHSEPQNALGGTLFGGVGGGFGNSQVNISCKTKKHMRLEYFVGKMWAFISTCCAMNS